MDEFDSENLELEKEPYVKRKTKNTYKHIDVENIKDDPMNRYNPDYMARSIDIMKLSSKLNKVKLLPKIKRNSRQS